MSSKAYLLIGGPFDGRRVPSNSIIVRHTLLRIPIPEPISIFDFKTLSDIPPEAPAPKVASYQAEMLRGQDVEIVFYRHIDTPLDHAIARLFDRYPQESAENTI